MLTATEYEELLAAVQHQAGYLDRLAVFGWQECDPARFRRWPSLKFYNVVPAGYIEGAAPSHTNTFSQVDLAQQPKLVVRLKLDNAGTMEEWRSAIEAILSRSEAGLLLEFENHAEIEKIGAALTGLDTSGREIWFGDWRWAAGFALEQNPSLPLRFPVSYDQRVQTYQIPSSDLTKAGLSWVLAQRRRSRV